MVPEKYFPLNLKQKTFIVYKTIGDGMALDKQV